jgi:hypothetical protein
MSKTSDELKPLIIIRDDDAYEDENGKPIETLNATKTWEAACDQIDAGEDPAAVAAALVEELSHEELEELASEAPVDTHSLATSFNSTAAKLCWAICAEIDLGDRWMPKVQPPAPSPT